LYKGLEEDVQLAGTTELRCEEKDMFDDIRKMNKNKIIINPFAVDQSAIRTSNLDALLAGKTTNDSTE